NDMTRNVVMERQSQLLEEHFTELKDHLASTQGTNVEKALGEAVDKMTVLLEKQGSNGAGPDALLNAFGELRGDLDKRFTELTSAIRESGTGLREDIKKANAEGLKAEIAALRADLEQK